MAIHLVHLISVLPILIISCNGDPDYLSILRNNPKISEDGRLSFLELAAKYGNPGEEHHIITEDGYNITVFHLPGDSAFPVLLAHGNVANADVFIIRGDTSMAITLANIGYDVWIINFRGTMYSDRHVTIDPKTDPERFYNYSFYEQGVYDLTAAVDYILEQTRQQQLVVVGHSMGTSSFFAMAADRPAYNDKVKLFISMSSIVFLEHQQGLFATVSPYGAVGNKIAKYLGISVTAGLSSPEAYMIRAKCLDPAEYETCIRDFLFSAIGSDEAGLEPEFSRTLFGHYPGTTSRKMNVHYAQLANRNKFAHYDYGVAGNLVAYNSMQPPKFNLSAVTSKVALFVGKADLSLALPNVVYRQLLPYESFNHMDFVFGQHVMETFYPYFLYVLSKYS